VKYQFPSFEGLQLSNYPSIWIFWFMIVYRIRGKYFADDTEVGRLRLVEQVSAEHPKTATLFESEIHILGHFFNS